MSRPGLIRAAAGIAVVTMLARVAGFGRLVVLSRTLGQSCVGDTYQAANSIPNVVFDAVAGGALAAVVVPVLSAALARGDQDAAQRIAAAILTRTVVLLAPLSLLALVAAPALMRALAGSNPSCGREELVVGARLLRVFAPQVLLYGIGIVLTGALEARRRFLGPAVAPLLSSAVVATAYLLYRASGPVSLGRLRPGQQLLLSVGTTLGVVVLSLSLLLPAVRAGVRLRPAWRLPEGTGRALGALALAGLAGVLAQQVALVVALRLAVHGPEGSVVVLAAASALSLLPWSVLALPLARSAFPLLAAAAGRGEHEEFARAAARALRLVLLAGCAGGALLAGTAGPVARLLVAGAPGVSDPQAVSTAVWAFAPGVVGSGALALLTRALYAAGRPAAGAATGATGWLAAAVADVLLVDLTRLPRVAALGAGTSIGLTLGAALGAVLLRRAGRGTLAGCRRTLLAGAAAGGLGLGAGWVAAAVLPTGAAVATQLLDAVLLAAAIALVFGGVVRLADPRGWSSVASHHA